GRGRWVPSLTTRSAGSTASWPSSGLRKERRGRRWCNSTPRTRLRCSSDGIPIQEVTDLDRDSYIPRATTPLLDAVGRLIARCDYNIRSCSHAGMPEENQVVVVITDGLENASREFSRQAIFDLITKRREQGWVFLFLGADQDVWAEGGRFGFSTHDRVACEKTQKGSEKMWKDLAYSTGEYRRMGESERSKRRDSFHQEEDSEE